VSVALVIQHAQRMRCIVLLCVACQAVPYFARYVINGTMFEKKSVFLSVVFPCMLIITQLLFQQNALVFIKSTRYYNLYVLSLYS
jgi:hypothetical protein